MKAHDKNIWHSQDDEGDMLSIRRGFLGTTRKVVSAFFQTGKEGSYVALDDIPALCDALWDMYDEAKKETR